MEDKEDKVVLCSAPKPEKPKRFYLKKWFIAILAAISSAYYALGTVSLAILIGIHGAEINDYKGELNTLVFIALMVIGIFICISELLGCIGTYKERIKWVNLYLFYSTGRFVIYLVVVAVLTLDSKFKAYLGMAIDVLFTLFFLTVTYYYLADLKAIRNAHNGNCTFKSKEEETNWAAEKSFV